MQYSLIMIKPNFTQYADEILQQIVDKTKATVLIKRRFRLSSALCDEHYAHIINKPFYAGHKKYMMSGDIIGAILFRANGNLTDDIRAVVGDTRGETEGTLRHYYRKLTGAGEIWENAIHCSGYDENGSPEGETECRRFARILGEKL